jgi:hypothetical protein
MLVSCSLLLSCLLALPLLVLLLSCHWPPLLFLMMRVLVFTVIIVADMDMWRSFAIGRGKLRRLKLAILHRVLVTLVLEDLRGVLLVHRYMICSCYFITLRHLCCQELLFL